MEIIENKKIFLSKKAAQSFSGYANKQLRSIENALASYSHSYEQREREQHILNTMKASVRKFNERYEELPEGSLSIYVDEEKEEICLDVNLKKYPLRDYRDIVLDMNNVLKGYSRLSHRKRKKDDEHLNKHAMHLVRLYLTCLDILEKEEINTYRENDIDMLMDIRNGKYQKEDGTYCKEFFDLVKELESKVKYAVEHTGLGEDPDYRRIEELMVSVNERDVRGDFGKK
jgi:predicted nucleotidyltransferase